MYLICDDSVKTPGMRKNVNENLGSTLSEVPVEFFQNYILPSLHQKINISAVVQTLKQKGVILDSGRWDGFTQDPADRAKEKKDAHVAKSLSDQPEESRIADNTDESQALENIVFADLTKVIAAIIAHSGVDEIPTVEYSSEPDAKHISLYDKRSNRPDGYFLFRDREMPQKAEGEHRHYWRDFCTLAEFKLNDSPKDIRDDKEKTVWNIFKVMREDPRRRFAFAFTIQNTTMRVWFASRSEVLVSEPFDFIQDKEKFVHFVLAQAFAKDYQLGIDPTMKVVGKQASGELVYDITVLDSDSQVEHVFRTRELINDDGTGDIRGRGTRVWSVDKVVDGNVKKTEHGLVLKDSWIDHDRKREGQILREIRNSYTGDTTRNMFDDFFLTIICHGNVYINEDEDTTRGLMTSGTIPPRQPRFDLRCGLAKPPPIPDPPTPSDAPNITKTEAEASLPASASLNFERIIEFYPKTHYRIVFLQRCKPLSKERLLSKVFGYLASIVAALQFLHYAEPAWVHRDISAGNILIDSQGNARLADLEYAKELYDDTSHDVRTGTVNFMAVEVDSEKYLFLPPPMTPDSALATEPDTSIDDVTDIANTVDLVRAARDDGATAQEPVNVPTPYIEKKHVFRHNPLHDFESLLWVAINYVINKKRGVPLHPQDKSLMPTSTDRKNARGLFYGRGERLAAMLQEGIIEETLRALPAPLTPVGELLIELKTKLVAGYKTAEIDPPNIGKKVAQNLYTLFVANFSAVRRVLLAIGDVVVDPLAVYIDPSKQANNRTPGTKRNAPEERGSTQSKRQRSSQNHTT